jgi:hypothetical protein
LTRDFNDSPTVIDAISKGISKVAADIIGIVDSTKISLYILWSNIAVEDVYRSTIEVENPYYSTITFTY